MSIEEKAIADSRRRAGDKVLSALSRRGWDVLLCSNNDAQNLWRVNVSWRIGEIGIATLVPFGRLIEGDYLTVMEVAENLVNTFEHAICGIPKKAARA